jgi:phosphatidylglycerophosphate synthase
MTTITARTIRLRRTDRELAAVAVAQLALLGVLSAAVGLGPVGWPAGVVFAGGLCVLFGAAAHRAGAIRLGPADVVTASRAVLVGGVTALVADGLWTGRVPVALLVVMAAVALVLDAVDGQVARRSGTASPLGARFDMEVDAALILVLSAHVAVLVGPWVLAIGLMRYAYVAVSWAVPWMASTVPPRYSAKVVAVAQGIVLVVATSQLLPLAATAALLALALAALTWSFGCDVVWLWGNRQAVRP